MTNAAWALGAAVAAALALAGPGRAASRPAPVDGPPVPPSRLAMRIAAPGQGGCPPASAPNAAPVYPEMLIRRGLEGTVILRVGMDRCGFVRDVGVYRSSRNREFDLAAVQAVRQWRLADTGEVAPDADGLLVAALPVRFELEDRDAPLWDDPAAMQASWCESMAALAPVAGEAAPAYIADPVPLAGSVEEIVNGLPEWAAYHAMMGAEGRYEVERLLTREEYRVTMPGAATHPSVIRRRRVHDGTRALWVTSYVCEADADACAGLKRFVELDGEQWVDTSIARYRDRQWTCPAPTPAK